MSGRDLDGDGLGEWGPEPAPDPADFATKPNGLDRSLYPATWVWRDPRSLPPRPWLLGSLLLAGTTTLLGAPGGAGKTTVALAMTLAVITDRRDIMGQTVFGGGGPCWYITLEDDRDELDRRIAAGIIAHGIDGADVAGKLWLNHPTLTLLNLVNGEPRLTKDVASIKKYISDNKFVLVIIDPLIKAHAVTENNNDHMDKLIETANDIARETGAAVMLTCHFRKPGPGGSGAADRDAFRGGTALVDGARIAWLVAPMTAEEAKNFFGEDREDDADRFIRLVNAKANMTRKATARDWFELRSVPLGNTRVDPRYPAGDHVQAVVPWGAPKLFDGMGRAVMADIFGRLGDEKQVWSRDPGRGRQWAGDCITQHGKSRQQAKDILDQWQNSGVVCITTEKRGGHDRQRLVLDWKKANAVLDGIREGASYQDGSYDVL